VNCIVAVSFPDTRLPKELYAQAVFLYGIGEEGIVSYMQDGLVQFCCMKSLQILLKTGLSMGRTGGPGGPEGAPRLVW
jgi:hypothetical protein